VFLNTSRTPSGTVFSDGTEPGRFNKDFLGFKSFGSAQHSRPSSSRLENASRALNHCSRIELYGSSFSVICTTSVPIIVTGILSTFSGPPRVDKNVLYRVVGVIKKAVTLYCPYLMP
jgi:hypothetical protein